MKVLKKIISTFKKPKKSSYDEAPVAKVRVVEEGGEISFISYKAENMLGHIQVGVTLQDEISGKPVFHRLKWEEGSVVRV